MAELPPLTLVLGGAASGKSAFAEQLVACAQLEKHYIATAQAFDDEMHAKIQKHQNTRAADRWVTHEEPRDLAPVLHAMSADKVVLLDCATLWLTNQLMADTDLDAASRGLVPSLISCPAAVVVVSNEVGQGIVPEHAMSRQFREAQGKLNQLVARDAQLVVQVIAGLPMVLKGTLPEGMS
ncbi:MAG: bifunctional adenosylcobinamide kinase/adenosylcobinamide-phosphate guanylyltransferase [Litoreibacter sp.]|uniref:bifunctional adenosylcobinamide kinase/adenosylcobinamide-phosphate guanylyltransferase n=1 Tax=Litoreibacter sp. TaxID=1969459 RepID=UPI00329769B2